MVFLCVSFFSFKTALSPLSEVWNADLLPSNDKDIGAESISLSYDDVPSFSFKRALNMMEAFWGALERINYFSELFESNESTMEKSNKNPVSPPEDIEEYIEINYFKHSKTKRKWSTFDTVTLSYGFKPKRYKETSRL